MAKKEVREISESEIYYFSRSTTQNFLRRPTMVANIFEDFEPPSKKFLISVTKYLKLILVFT